MKTQASWLLAALVASGCGAPQAQPMGPSQPPDPSAIPFRSDRATSWTDFRLGDGLNVVVADPGLPRELSWRANAGPNGISSSPVVYRNLLLVASNDRNLYAIDAATGTVRWRYLATNELMTQPLYARGIAVVASGNQECLVCLPPDYVIGGTGSSRMSGVDLQTGRERWGQELAGTGMPTGALVGENIVHADGSGTVLALDAASGRYRWHVRVPSSFAMSSVINGRDGRVYVSGVFRAAVYALRATDGALLWRTALPKWYQGPGDGPMAATPRLLVSQYLKPLAPGKLGWVVFEGSRVSHHIFALDRQSGRLVWDREVDRGISPAFNQSAIPLIYRGSVYEGSASAPVVSALDAATGRIRWQLPVGGAVKGGIAARGGVLYFGDNAGFLWAVDAATGSLVGRLHTNLSYNVGSAIILNDSLIVGSRQGTVVAIPLRSIRRARDPLRPS
jgi:outer membrane protein assembly factor BamB